MGMGLGQEASSSESVEGSLNYRDKSLISRKGGGRACITPKPKHNKILKFKCYAHLDIFQTEGLQRLWN